MKVGERRTEFETGCEWLSSPTTAINGLHILYFWSMSCSSCHVNMPHLQKVRDEYASKGVSVVGIHRPMTEDDLNLERVRDAVKELGVIEPCALDNDHHIGDAMGVTAWPTYFLFDGDHKLRRRAMGNFGIRMIESALKQIFDQEEHDKV